MFCAIKFPLKLCQMVSTCGFMFIQSSSFLFSVPGGWPKWTTAIGSLAWLGWSRRSHDQRMSLVYSLLWIPLCENLELTDCDLSESLYSFLHGFLCMVFALRVPVSSSFLSSSLGIVMVTWQPCSSLYLTYVFANSTIVLGWPKSLGFSIRCYRKPDQTFGPGQWFSLLYTAPSRVCHLFPDWSSLFPIVTMSLISLELGDQGKIRPFLG